MASDPHTSKTTSNTTHHHENHTLSRASIQSRNAHKPIATIQQSSSASTACQLARYFPCNAVMATWCTEKKRHIRSQPMSAPNGRRAPPPDSLTAERQVHMDYRRFPLSVPPLSPSLSKQH
ncbi:hypothetical protein J6590_019145 [Homalodisca vitripennis]|nr:hypothetical protein J6590_019145 [Homalodisca vitripennis]